MVSKEINSNAYIMGITKTTFFSDLYRLFYNRIMNNVTDTVSPKREKWIFPAFPDYDIDNSESYPICIINSPDPNWEKRTYHTKWIVNRIEVELYCASMSQLDDLSGEIIDAIEKSNNIFKNIKIQFLNLDGTTTDHFPRDQITIHNRVFTFTCRYRFTKTN